MKSIKIVWLVMVVLTITGCSKKTEDKAIPESTTQESSRSTESVISYDGDEEFYESIEGRSGRSMEENKTATEVTSESTTSRIEVIETNNGDFKLSIPQDWQKTKAKELSDSADIELKNTTDTAYYMVLSEKKKEFDSFSAFKNSVDISDLGEKKDEKKESIEYNGLKGERRTFIAKKEGVEVYYIYDLLEGKDYFMQCISWTQATDKEANESQMKVVMSSLSELD